MQTGQINNDFVNSEPTWEWKPLEIANLVVCVPGKAYEPNRCDYVTNVLNPSVSAYNPEISHVQQGEDIIPRIYDKNLLENVMNDEHYELIKGKLPSLIEEQPKAAEEEGE